MNNTNTSSELALSKIKKLITQNKLLKGNKLPNERLLSDITNSKRAHVRNALLILEKDGLITRKVGNGTFLNQSSIQFIEFKDAGITKKDIQVDGVITLKGDFTDKDILNNVHLGKARICIVFAEQRDSEDDKTIDMRSIMTAFLIEYDYPELHTIVELNNKENATTVNDKVRVNEFINKEEIDGKLIAASIKTPNLSKHFKQIYFNEGLGNVKISKISEIFKYSGEITYKKLKELSIEKDFTIIGIISKDTDAVISVKNDDMIKINDSVIYI